MIAPKLSCAVGATKLVTLVRVINLSNVWLAVLKYETDSFVLLLSNVYATGLAK